MGSSAHMAAMEHVLAKYGDELRAETWEDVPEAVKALGPALELEAEIDDITRWLVFAGADGERHYLHATVILVDRRRA
jgi:hypothetical protein